MHTYTLWLLIKWKLEVVCLNKSICPQVCSTIGQWLSLQVALVQFDQGINTLKRLEQQQRERWRQNVIIVSGFRFNFLLTHHFSFECYIDDEFPFSLFKTKIMYFILLYYLFKCVNVKLNFRNAFCSFHEYFLE